MLYNQSIIIYQLQLNKIHCITDKGLRRKIIFTNHHLWKYNLHIWDMKIQTWTQAAELHCSMSSWDVARLTVRLGDHNIKLNSEVHHIEKKVKRVVRHRGFDSRTLVGNNKGTLHHTVSLEHSRKICNQFLKLKGMTVVQFCAITTHLRSFRQKPAQINH